MIFKTGAQFQQLMHCKFRESIIRTLNLPSLDPKNPHIFLIVNKFGKVGLYNPESFILLHTFLLDLSIPMLPDKVKIPGYPKILPKCQNTHLVVDAIYAEDCKAVIYLTTKGILQVYDIGEIETDQPYAVDLIPRKEFRDNLKFGKSPVIDFIKNKGHVETHRIHGLPSFPICMEYYPWITDDKYERDKIHSVLLIGNSDGCITIIYMKNPKLPFGKRKIRGMMHSIKAEDLVASGLIDVYKAHMEPITALRFLPSRKLVISSSRDKKFSLIVKDLTDSLDTYIASVSKGVNTFANSDTLKVIVAGSDDCMLRFFNQLVATDPIAELDGHKCPIVALEFFTIPFATEPILISFSKDLELITWNPTNYHCLQKLYISFPPRSMINLCKTPEFGRHTLCIYQQVTEVKTNEKLDGSYHSFLLILYCNNFAKLPIEKDAQSSTEWPFDFHCLKQEFDELERHVKEKEKRRKQETKQSQNPKKVSFLTPAEIESIESKLDFYMNDVLSMKRQVERKLGKVVSTTNENSLSAQVVRKMSEFKSKDNKKLIEHGYGFSLLPTFDVDDIKFRNGSLPITTDMKDNGILDIKNPKDLLREPVQQYLQNINKTIMNYRIAEKSFPNIIQENSDDEFESSDESKGSLSLSHEVEEKRLMEKLEKVFELRA